MKTLLPIPILILASVILSGCTPKSEPRYKHEDYKAWTPKAAPRDESVETASLRQVSVQAGYALLAAPSTDLVKAILKPYARFVLNAKFTATPSNRGSQLSQMISIFEKAFLTELDRHNATPEFAKIKEDFINTVFDGCARDLRTGCNIANYFALQPNHIRIFALLAGELDSAIAKDLTDAKSEEGCIGILLPGPASGISLDRPWGRSGDCRALVEERYRRLSMAMYQKRTTYDDTVFDFAYLKYAALFSLLVDYGHAHEADKNVENTHDNLSFSYMAEMNASIYQTIISRYLPKDMNDPEFKAFVNASKPAQYSIKKSRIFQGSATQLFDFWSSCCMYVDQSRTHLAPSVAEAINESQSSSDTFGLSFRQMIEDIKYPPKNFAEYKEPDLNAKHDTKPDYSLFEKMHLMDLVQRAENPKSGFYNEYFLIVDRLFRGHLTAEQAERFLRNTNQTRALTEFPRMITDYFKIYLVHMVVQTNRFMAKIYNSNIASNAIFQAAGDRSRELSDRWHAIQTSIELLDRLMGSYFKGRNLGEVKEFTDATTVIQSVNRNIHYLSVFPNMIAMNYFLAYMNGPIQKQFWGEIYEIDAGTVVKSFFDGGIPRPWFGFGVDAQALDRTMLLYSVEYLITTQYLDSFVAKDITDKGNVRSRFFDVIFTKYLDDSISDLHDAVTKFKKDTLFTSEMAQVGGFCDYEEGRTSAPPDVAIPLDSLGQYTYSGIGDVGVNKPLNAFLGGVTPAMEKLRAKIRARRQYVQAIIDVVAKNETFERQSELDSTRAMVAQLDSMEAELTNAFLTDHHRYFKCATALLEIEKRRTKRLYDEERQHLGRVFDQMKPLYAIDNTDARFAAARQINETFFTAANGYRIDELNGLTYLMSKHDLLMRMKTRLETDVFRTPTIREMRAYHETRPAYYRPRPVRVYYDKAGLERDAMIEHRLSIPVIMHGTDDNAREDFIRQGMAALNGGNGAFINWSSRFTNETGLLGYLTALEQIYLNGPTRNEDGKVVQVTKEEIVNAYIKIYSTLTLDDLDLQNARDFGVAGRYAKSYFQGKFFEGDGLTRLPFFYSLMDDVAKMANMGLVATGDVQQALDLAKAINAKQAFVFEPSPAVPTVVKSIYGPQVNGLLSRVGELFSYLNTVEASVDDVGQLDPHLRQPFYIEGGLAVRWFDGHRKNLVDHQKFEDHKILVEDFRVQSRDFYDTSSQVHIR